MRKELDLEEMTGASGGKYVINGNTNQVAFRENRVVYKLKCSPYQAMELMDSFIGMYPTEEEYNNRCIEELKARGWI